MIPLLHLRRLAVPFALSAFVSCIACARADQLGVLTYVDNGSTITITDCSNSATGEVLVPATIVGKPVTRVLSSTFYNCTQITSVSIPEGVTAIESSTFDGCLALTSVSIPSTVTSINDRAFSYCASLASINLPAGLTGIGAYAFDHCYALAAVTIPQGVTTLGRNAFDKCLGLTSLSIPSTVAAIPTFCFNDCSGLTEVNLPVGVTSIGTRAFGDCDRLTQINLPEGITTLGSLAFASCDLLEEVSLPSTLSGTTAGFFLYCPKLLSITVAPSNAAFKSVDGVLFNKSGSILLEYPGGRSGSYSIPEGVTTINAAFNSCSKLTGISIPTTVTVIGDSAFGDCSGLTTVTIPLGVTELGVNSFRRCTGLVSVGLPQSLLTIKDWAFADCSALESIPLPANLTTIGFESFAMCVALEDVQFLAGLKTIGIRAYKQCASLEEVSVPAGVTTIGGGAFTRCTKLESISVAPANANYSSLDGVLFNKSRTLLIQYPSGRDGAYVVPPGVTQIGDASFAYTIGLTEVTIPEGVTSIGSSAFSDCTALGAVTLPQSLATLSFQAFYKCSSLKSACFLGNSPPMELYKFVFDFAASGFSVFFFDGATGFSVPTWWSYPAVNLGAFSPFKPWLLEHGLAHDSDLEADTDADGVPLLLAYAFRLDPRKNVTGSLPPLEINGNFLTLTYQIGVPGVTYRAEASTDLVNWSTEGVIVSGPDSEGKRVASIDRTAGASKYLRVAVTY